MGKKGTEKVTAPYNFVSLPEQVYERYGKSKDLPKHNRIYGENDEKLSGDITFRIEAVTDIAIGGSQDLEFYRDTDGKFAIPGSTLRGLFRTNMQILGYSAVGDDIEDFRYMYRKVGETQTDLASAYKKNLLNVGTITPANKEEITVCRNVRAGYIRKEGEDYILYDNIKTNDVDTKQELLDYYPIRETEIFRKKYKDGDNKFDMLFGNKPSILQYAEKYDNFKVKYKIYCKNCKKERKNYTAEEKDIKKKDIIIDGKVLKTPCKFCGKEADLRKHIVGEPNERYVPYSMEISYEADGLRITAIGKPGVYSMKGYVLSSGYVSEKKVLYVIPEMGKYLYTLPQPDIQTYKRDFENKKKLLGTTGFKGIGEDEKKKLCEKYAKFFQLPEEGEFRPVFYIKYDEKYYFGYTQYLRVFYKHSINDGVPSNHRKFVYDYARSIFGYSKNSVEQNVSESYKGRVYFEDSRLIQEADSEKKNLHKTKVTLEAPKPSSYLDYLQQEKNYDDEDFRIRGIKQYWFKENAARAQGSDKDSVTSEFSYLEKGACFEAKVRFKNLHEDELGLLLWCIRLEKGCQQNIGKAKPYGYGRIKIDGLQLNLLDLKKMYSLESLDFNPYSTYGADKIDQYINLYKQYMNTKIAVKERKNHEEFFIMKNAEKIPDITDTGYMPIGKDTSNRVTPLPTPEEVIKSNGAGKFTADSNGSTSKDRQKNKNQRTTMQKNPEGRSQGSFGSRIDMSNIDIASLPKE